MKKEQISDIKQIVKTKNLPNSTFVYIKKTNRAKKIYLIITLAASMCLLLLGGIILKDSSHSLVKWSVTEVNNTVIIIAAIAAILIILCLDYNHFTYLCKYTIKKITEK